VERVRSAARARRGQTPRAGAGRVHIEHDQPEAARAEEDLRRAERVAHAARSDPEQARERDAGRGGGLRLEGVLGIDPGDGLAGARGGGRDGAGEPRPSRARRPGELGDPSARQPAAERLVEDGEAGGQPPERLGTRGPEAQVPRPADPIEEGGGGGHWPRFAFSSLSVKRGDRPTRPTVSDGRPTNPPLQPRALLATAGDLSGSKSR